MDPHHDSNNIANDNDEDPASDHMHTRHQDLINQNHQIDDDNNDDDEEQDDFENHENNENANDITSDISMMNSSSTTSSSNRLNSFNPPTNNPSSNKNNVNNNNNDNNTNNNTNNNNNNNPTESDDDEDDGSAPSVDSSSSSGPQFLPPDHPLMNRIQQAFQASLVKRDQELTLELREKREAVAAAKREREALGVSLYSQQQALAKLQLSLEKHHNECTRHHNNRLNSEQLLQKAASSYQEQLKIRDELERKRFIAQAELDKLKITVKQVDEHNTKVKNEILVQRRAAFGTEESMQVLEKQKSIQDRLIDETNEEIRIQEEQIRLNDAQIVSQRQETMKARELLNEAIHEMDLIAIEKREYLAKWRATITGMMKRDQALEQAEHSLKIQREKLQNYHIQLDGYRHAIRAEQNDNNRCTQLLTRVQSEIRFMDQQLEAIAETRKQLSSKHALLRSTLERTDAELREARAEQRELRADLSVLQTAHSKLQQSKSELDQTLLESLNSQTTLEKGAANIWKLASKLKQQVHEKEIQVADISNEIARIKVDTLNTNAHNKELQLTLDAYDRELKDKDKLIEKYEMEIRQRHDKIEKKQIYIARLNRKLEILASSAQEENTGPLEATIANLEKETQQVQKEVADMQREWIKTQTELVALVTSTNEQNDIVKELKAKETILHQKSLRLTSGHTHNESEIKELKGHIKSMHSDMSKLNELLAANSRLCEELTNANFTSETTYMSKLKQLESNSIEQEALIQQIKMEKESILAEIIEIEKQIMLWEKKITLERETQEALDPEYGQPEIKGMKKEIHRMRLRLTQLKRQQEKAIAEMERTIAKRDNIKLVAVSTKNASIMTQAALKKKIHSLKDTLATTTMEAKKVVEEIAKQEENNGVLANELEKQQGVFNEMEMKKASTNNLCEEVAFRKQMALEATIITQKRAKRYEDALNGKLKVAGNKEKIMNDLFKAEEKFQKVKDALVRLQAEEPKYESYFKRLLEYM